MLPDYSVNHVPGLYQPKLLLTRRPTYCDQADLLFGRRAAEPCLVRRRGA